MRALKFVAGFSAVLMAVAPSSMADDAGSLPVPAQSRLRVYARGLGGRPAVGDVVAVADGNLLLSAGNGKQRSVALGDVTRVEMRTRRSSKGRAAIYGALGGALLLYGINENSCDHDDILFTEGTCDRITLGFGAVLGAGLGALIAKGERWERVPVETFQRRAALASPGLSLQAAPRGRGVAAALTLRF